MFPRRLGTSPEATHFSFEADPQPVHPGVLIVDDEALVRSVLEIGLTRSGFTTWQAASGTEAVEVYRTHQAEITLVVLDVRMPGMNGLQTLDALKAINPAVVVCFLTGDSGELSEEELLAHGAAVVLYKPFRLDDLMTMLWGYVGNR